MLQNGYWVNVGECNSCNDIGGGYASCGRSFGGGGEQDVRVVIGGFGWLVLLDGEFSPV